MNLATLMFTIWPYIALVLFVVGHIWRWRYDQFGWTTRTSQILEKRWLFWASPIFHVGALMVVAGHAMGLIFPKSWTEMIGIDEHTYHLVAVLGGAIAGILLSVGLILLILRRFLLSTRIRLVTTPWDKVMYFLIFAVVFCGMWSTFQHNVFGSGYDYRRTVAVWFRGIFYGNPDASLMAGAPLAYQLHVILAFALVAVWPLTRLVHVWSVPLGYLFRPYVVYRRSGSSRGTGGRGTGARGNGARGTGARNNGYRDNSSVKPSSVNSSSTNTPVKVR